ACRYPEYQAGPAGPPARAGAPRRAAPPHPGDPPPLPGAGGGPPPAADAAGHGTAGGGTDHALAALIAVGVALGLVKLWRSRRTG
ncbi:hypothetical protein ACFV0G_26455, partial [Kitasatospora sp. NPDC059571]